jgi:hypothetical protein
VSGGEVEAQVADVLPVGGRGYAGVEEDVCGEAVWDREESGRWYV